MVSSSDIAFWTAAGTWALVIGTLFLMYWQTRQNQQLNSANAVMTLRERFDSPRVRVARRHLSDRLIRGAHEDIANLEVANFFELIGAQTYRKVLDTEMIWDAFGGWVTSYYWALRHPVDLIGRLRSDLKDPLVFFKFEWLNDRIMAIDRKRLGAQHTASVEAQEEAMRFLRREAVLDAT